MIQTPVFRNINIFFLIQTYGSYIYTVQKIILRPAGPRFITAMTGGGRWLQEGTQGGGKRMDIAHNFFFFFYLLGIGYTHILREVEGLYIILDTVHSTPPPIHGPSFSHSVAFSLDRHHAYAHTINYNLNSLFHSFTFYLSCLLSHLSTLRYCSDILSFFFSLF